MTQLTSGGKRAEQYRRGYYKALSASPSKRRGSSRSQSQGGSGSISPKGGGMPPMNFRQPRPAGFMDNSKFPNPNPDWLQVA